MDVPVGNYPLALAAEDVNGDGRRDLVVANYQGASVSVLFAGGGGFGAKTDFPTGSFPQSVAIGDVSGDGRLDLAVANVFSNSVSVLLGTGAGGFGARADFPSGSGPSSVAIGDLNGDGRLDLAVANVNSSNVSVLLGMSAGGFGAKTDFPTGSNPTSVTIGDVSGDGRLDLAVANYLSNTVSVLLGTGAGGFGAKTDFPTGFAPFSVAIGDLSGDGRLDLAVANYGFNTVSVLLGQGAGGFDAKTDFPTGSGPISVTIGDVSGDGRLDLAVANYGSNSVSVLLGTGAGGFGAKTDFPTGVNPRSVALGDVSGDGRLDLAVANDFSNSVSVLLGTGAGGFGAKTDFPTGFAPFSVAIGDLSGDGRLDLAVANYVSITVSVLLGHTPTRTSLVAAPVPAVLGAPVLFTATVSVPAPGSGTPTGTVSFFDGTTSLGTAPVNSGEAALAFFAPYLGDRAIAAVYNGDARYSGSFSSPRTQRVVSTSSPAITSIVDVRPDQGGQVRLTYGGSAYDYLGSPTPIASYYVYRRSGLPALAAEMSDARIETSSAGTTRGASGRITDSHRATSSRSRVARLAATDAEPPEIQIAGWDYLVTVPATTDGPYVVVVPTLVDSNSSGIHHTKFMVRAATSTPGVFYDSVPDSGYSVDNLPPATPAPFAGAYFAGAIHLRWGRNIERDVWYYRVYRGNSAAFVPGPSNLIATLSDTVYVVTSPPAHYYKLAAVDVNGNESGYALLTPSATDLAGQAAVFAISEVRNPVRGDRMDVSFSLADAKHAELSLFNVAGQRITTRTVGHLGPGFHFVDLAEGRRLAAGFYLIRLSAGSRTATRRVVVVP